MPFFSNEQTTPGRSPRNRPAKKFPALENVLAPTFATLLQTIPRLQNLSHVAAHRFLIPHRRHRSNQTRKLIG